MPLGARSTYAQIDGPFYFKSGETAFNGRLENASGNLIFLRAPAIFRRGRIFYWCTIDSGTLVVYDKCTRINSTDG